MDKLFKNKKVLGGIAALVVLAGVIVAAVFSLKGNKPSKTTPTGAVTATPTPDMTDYKEVRFALPAGISELDAGKTKLPETLLVPKGTKVSELSRPRQMGKVFLGWYYDDALTLTTLPGDSVDTNMTLYPKFGDRADLSDTFSYDYISREDVAANYGVFVTGHNLNAEKVKELIGVHDMTLGDVEAEFTITEVKSSTEEPDEPKQDTEEEVNELLLKIGINLDDFDGVPDFHEIYGLEEDDSPERYWREELQLDPDTVLALTDACRTLRQAAWEKETVYQVVPKDGAWTEGHLFQIELSETDSLRFYVDDQETGEEVTKFNITVTKKPYNNLEINSDVVFIPLKEVGGIEKLEGIYKVSMDDTQKVETVRKSGEFTYQGELAPGTTVAIYDGELGKDGRVDGNVGYYKISEKKGDGKYAYEGADFTDVLFIPDLIPVADDGTFSDGSVRLGPGTLSFSGKQFEHLRNGKNTVVEKGDYLYFYTGAAKGINDLKRTGVGRVTEVKKDGNGLLVTYAPTSYEEVANYGMYERVAQIDIPIEQIDKDAVLRQMTEQLDQNQFAVRTGDYIVGLINGDYDLPDDPEMVDALKRMTFKTDKGEDISIESLRLLGSPSRVEVSKPTLDIQISGTCEHFHGSGARVVVSVGFTIKIKLNGNNQIEIQCVAALEQEIVLGVDLATSFDLTAISETTIDASLRAGTFTGFGAQATIMTTTENPNENTEWGRLLQTTGAGTGQTGTNSGKLLNMAEKLGQLADGLEKVQEGGTYQKGKGAPGSLVATADKEGAKYSTAGGDLPSKYSAMLENDAQYIDLMDVKLFEFDFRPPGPLAVIDFTIQGDLVVSFKLNAMIGFSISYGNAKQISYHVEPFNDVAKSTTTDLETPNFRADFFVFGMTGLRVGVRLDARIGFLSTSFDSIGVVAEVGLYGEFYGFLYIYYAWESGKGSDSGAMGSLLFELGSYLDVKFKAQLGDDKLSKEIDLYNKRWPLIQLGDTEVPVPYQSNEDDDAALAQLLEIESGKNTVKVPDAVFKVDVMDLQSGKVSRVSKDSKKVGQDNYSFNINGRTYTQYNELNFEVECYDLDGKDGKPTNNHSFQYLPATNEIYIKPVDNDKDEYWGIVIFTYRNNGFGFSTVEFKHTLKVHWKGEPCTAVVNYYIHKPGGARNNLDGLSGNRDQYYEFVKEGEFHGFDGIDYDLIITEEFTDQFPGYRLMGVDYPGVMFYTEMTDKTYKEYEELEKKYKEMQKTPDKYTYAEFKKASDAVDNKLKLYWQLRKNYDEYYNNISDTLRTKNGTLYFTMVKNQTVVNLYFDEVKYDVTILRVTELPPKPVTSGREFIYKNNWEDANGRPYGATFDLSIRKDASILQRAEEITAKDFNKSLDVEWYYFLPKLREEYSNSGAYQGMCKIAIYKKPSGFDYMRNGDYIREHYSEWKRLTPETKMPDEDVILIAYEKKSEKEYKVTWINDFEEVIREDMVVYDHTVPSAPSIGNRKRDGYNTKIVWKDDKGVTYSENYKMPYRDVTFTAHVSYTGIPQPIKWIVDGEEWVTNGPAAGETLNVYPPSEQYHGNRKEMGYAREGGRLGLSGYTMTYKIVVEGVESDYTVGTVKMPYGGVTFICTHTKNSYKITWKDGDNVVKEEMVEYMAGLIPPKVAVGTDEVVTWGYDAKIYGWTEIFEGYTAISEDMVIYTKRHTHSWDEGTVVFAGDCSYEGSKKFTCKECGATKREALPKDPNNHYRWILKRTYRANCISPQIDVYECWGCGATREELIGEKDPNYHDQYERSSHYNVDRVEKVLPTCVNPGHEEAIYCVECGVLLSGNETIPATGIHSYTYTRTKEPTCTEDGTEKGVCSECQTEVTRAIPKLGHEWGEVTYELTDGNTKMTAKRTCNRVGTHVETETVSVNPRTVKAATCVSKGLISYDAQFTNEDFGKKSLEAQTEMINHSWGTVSYTLSTDKRSVKAVRTCGYTAEGLHLEEETKPVSYTVTNPATTSSTGKAVYSATFENPAFGTWSEEVILPIQICEHTWEDVIMSPWAEVLSDRVELHLGEKTQKCSKCGQKREGYSEEVRIKPTLKNLTMDFYEFMPDACKEGKLDEYTFSSLPIGEPCIKLPTAADGTGSITIMAMMYAAPQGNIAAEKFSEIDAKFQNGTIQKFEIPLVIQPIIIDRPVDTDPYESVDIGWTEDGKHVYAQTSYLEDAEVVFTLTCSHQHNWKSVTEEPTGYRDGTDVYHWRPGNSYSGCETCGLKKNVTVNYLQPYVRNEYEGTTFARSNDNTYEIHVPATYLAEEMRTWKSQSPNDGTLAFYLSNAVFSSSIMRGVVGIFYSTDGSKEYDKLYSEINSKSSFGGDTAPSYTFPEGVTAETKLEDLDKSVTIVYTYNGDVTVWQTIKIKLVIEP